MRETCARKDNDGFSTRLRAVVHYVGQAPSEYILGKVKCIPESLRQEPCFVLLDRHSMLTLGYRGEGCACCRRAGEETTKFPRSEPADPGT